MVVETMLVHDLNQTCTGFTSRDHTGPKNG